jgi:hypothetical protein
MEGMMTDRKRNPSAEQLERALDRMVEDVNATSDEEILKEANEVYGNADAAVARVQGALVAALKRSGQKKLKQARAGLGAARAAKPASNVVELSLAKKRRILDTFAGSNNPIGDKLTMAARNGVAIGEAEIDGMLQDLIELGAIDEHGNPV